MAYDGLTMAGITHELSSWVEARVEKIYQPAAAVLLISLHHAQQGRAKLLISADATGPRLHLTEGKWSNPAAPPMFCMLLRKHLEGSRLIAVEQCGLERIITLSLSGRDDLGNTVTYRLIAEIMGRHSNILLVSQEDKILDSIVRVPPAMSSVRMILPGLTYSYPLHQDRLDTLEVQSAEQLAAALQPEAAIGLSKALVAKLTGISPQLATELLHRANMEARQAVAETDAGQWNRLYSQLQSLQAMVRESAFHPSLSGKHFAALPLTHLPAEPWTGTVNELVDHVFTETRHAAAIQKQKQRLSAVARQLLQKDRRKEANQAEELAAMQQDLELRRKGELIISSLHLIAPKAESARVIDYYDPEMPEVEVSLNPQLNGTQNAQRYFKRYERARHGIPIVEKNLAATRAEIAYLDSLLDSIDRADQTALLTEIEQEMRQSGLLPQPPKGKAPAANPSEPLRFTSPDGAEILVGRNNLQNERLTKSASPDDWWLHTKDIPGSHVLIKGAGSAISPATLELAAGLAAYFSKARQSSKVPVDYTLRKHVKKPSGSPPGFVIYTDQQTVLIEPRAPEGQEPAKE